MSHECRWLRPSYGLTRPDRSTAERDAQCHRCYGDTMPIRRFVISAVLLGAAVAVTPSVASAQPKVSKFTAPSTITGRQGHARALVNVTSHSRSRVIVRLVNRRGQVVNTVKSAPAQPRGRVWLAMDATTLSGFQIPAGRYTLQAYAVSGKRRSNVLRRSVTIRFTRARGTIQALTVPAWPSTIAGIATAPGGQIVTAVAPDTPTAASGLVAGDVIRAVNGIPVDSAGQWLRLQRGLNAGVATTLDVDRAGARTRLSIIPAPDWTPRPDWSKILPAKPGNLATALSAIRARLDAGDVAGADALFQQLSTTDQRSAPGWLATGLIRLERNDALGAQAAFNYAVAADPAMTEARFQRGLALIARGRLDLAEQGLHQASGADPADALAPTFRAFALLRADRFADAFTAGQLAIAIDPAYSEGHIATGIAHISLGRKAAGVADIRKGLVLMDDAKRRTDMIARYLIPATR